MKLLRELKRRKVLHTLSLYVVGCWVVLQVVEVLSEAGLPPGTMRDALVAMSVGFPLVLAVAWFFDISKEGVSRTLPRSADEELPSLNLGDHAFVVGLLAVIVLNAYLLSSPAPQGDNMAAVAGERTLAVLPLVDIDPQRPEDTIGEVVASELRKEFTQVVGIRVLGPETSNVISLAGDKRDAVAIELGVTSILVGTIVRHGGEIELNTQIIGMPAGNVIWQDEFRSPVGDGAKLLKTVVRGALDSVIPVAEASPAHASRIEAGECSEVYDLYLRGKKMSKTERGLELLQEAVRIDENCAVAWEAIAVSYVDWSMPGFAKAGAAARRALEINDKLPEAWSVLAEIAEEEKRWGESEELFLRALSLDPSNAHANSMYSEALLARGRVRDSLHYVLEAYRYEPASALINWRVALSARYIEDTDTLRKHASIYDELLGGNTDYYWDDLAEWYRLQGDVEQAVVIYDQHIDEAADWYPQCMRARSQPELRNGLRARMRPTIDRHQSGELSKGETWFQIAEVIRCATWIDADDMVIEILSDEDIPSERQFFMFFLTDAGNLRQTEYFRNLVVESGLLDYWRKWGWSDYCRPDGDSFVCD